MAEVSQSSLAVAPRLQWSYFLIWTTFGFMTLTLLIPILYAFVKQFEQWEIPYALHLIGIYRSLMTQYYWGIISSALLSVVVGIYCQTLFAQFSDLFHDRVYPIISWIRRRPSGRPEAMTLEDRQKASIASLLGTSHFQVSELQDILASLKTGEIVHRVISLGPEDYRGFLTGGQRAISPASSSKFVVWLRDDRKDSIPQEPRFYYQIFSGIKGLMLLLLVIAFSASLAFLVILSLYSYALFSSWNSDYSNFLLQVWNSGTFIVLVIFFYGLFKGADSRMKLNRTAYWSQEKVLFAQWLDHLSNEELFMKEVRDKIGVLGRVGV